MQDDINRYDKKTRIENLVHEAYEKGLFNGTWLYAEKGKIISKGAIGFRDPDGMLPMEEDSIFEIASVSKQFTAAAIMLLYKRGLLGLDDKLSKYFPENPYEGVTIRHLLTHTSGIPDHETWAESILKGEKTIPNNKLCIRFLRESGLEAEFAPGENFEYSNTAFCLLAEIVEQVSNVPFEVFMRKEIFEPAGMLSTRVCHIRIEGIPFDNFARGQVLKDNRYIIPDELPEYNYVILLDGVSGDGLVYSNIFNLLAWDRCLREETLLTKADQSLMYAPGTLNNGKYGSFGIENEIGYGFGWDLYQDPELGLIVLHDGGWPGYLAHYERLLDADRILVFLSCRQEKDARGYDSFYDAMQAIVRDKEPKQIQTLEDIAIHDPDRSGWDNLCGKYETTGEDAVFIEEVFMNDGNLFTTLLDPEDQSREKHQLFPLGENKFGMKWSTVDVSFSEGCVAFLNGPHKKLN